MTYIWEHEAWPNLTYDEEAFRRDFERTVGKAGKLAGLRAGLSEEDRLATYVTELSEETVNSYAIEGETLDRRSLRDSLTASLMNRDRTAAAGAYRNVADVMIDARDTSKPMTVDRLNGWHKLMFERDRWLKDVGRLRSGPMGVYTSRPAGREDIVHFLAPPPERVPAEMDGLMSWIARTAPDGPEGQRHQTPGRAALAHLWFETIHPYEDGNGRIGRALADFVMAQSPTFADAPFSLSRVIQEEKKSYYAALEAASKPKPTATGTLDVTPFVGWFGETMDKAIDRTTEMSLHINARNRFFERFAGELNPRQEEALRYLFEQGPERLEQGLSSRRYRRTTGVSRQTASRDLAELVQKGALLPPEQGGRSTAYPVNLAGRAAGNGPSLGDVTKRIDHYEALVAEISDPERQARAGRLVDAMRDVAGRPGRSPKAARAVQRGRSDVEAEPER